MTITHQEITEIGSALIAWSQKYDTDEPSGLGPDDYRERAIEASGHVKRLYSELLMQRLATAKLLQGLTDAFADERVYFDSIPEPTEPQAVALYHWYKRFQRDMMTWLQRERALVADATEARGK